MDKTKLIMGVVISLLILVLVGPLIMTIAVGSRDATASKTYVKVEGANTPENIQLLQTPIATASVRVLYDNTPIPTNTPTVNHATGVVTIDDGTAGTVIRVDYTYVHQSMAFRMFVFAILFGMLGAGFFMFKYVRGNK